MLFDIPAWEQKILTEILKDEKKDDFPRLWVGPIVCPNCNTVIMEKH